jgi:site-specific DNA-methyltransferase (adenine-specific)
MILNNDKLNLAGTTYSVAAPDIYEEYKKTKNGELFEGLVHDLILNRYSDCLNTNKFILSLPKRDQRLAILSLVDKERKGDVNLLWREMKAYVDSRTDKMDHVKDVIGIINKFVKDGTVEKKTHGEVMTPISLVREMLDTLPKEVWSNPNLKFLDPCNGAGTFPFVVIYKLMRGLAEWEPNIEKRYKHIVENMIYTCEIQSRNVFLWLCGVDPHDEYTTNTYWGSFLDEGFDKHMKEVWCVDNFDIVVGNPPYQEIDGLGGNGSSAIPIYNIFIDKLSKFSTLITFIIPSRWMAGGKGLENFRKRMLNDKKIRYIKDIPNSSNIFPNTEISGGVCFFLWDKNYNGFCKFNDETKLRDLSEFDILIRDFISISILKKVLKKHKIFFDKSVLPQKPYGMRSNYNNWLNNGIQTITREGLKFANPIDVVDKFDSIDKFKVLISKADGASYNSGRFISKYLIAKPKQVCLETHLVCGLFDTELEAINAGDYFLLKFTRFMLSLRLISQNNSSDKFKWVPNMLNYNNKYKDVDLYNYFNLSKDEIEFIEKKIKKL